MAVVPVEREVILSAQEVFKQTKVNVLEKLLHGGMEMCMGSDRNPQWQVLLTDWDKLQYKVSVNLLGGTESKPKESQILFNMCCPLFNVSFYAQDSGEHFSWIESI